MLTLLLIFMWVAIAWFQYLFTLSEKWSNLTLKWAHLQMTLTLAISQVGQVLRLGQVQKNATWRWQWAHLRGGNYKKIQPFLRKSVKKKITCPALFLPVLDKYAASNFHNFSLSFGKVPKIFTCPTPFLPVPDRRTVNNFHPCTLWFAHVTNIVLDIKLLHDNNSNEVTYYTFIAETSLHALPLGNVWKFHSPSSNTFLEMNYFLVWFVIQSRWQTTDRQKVMHMSPPCKVHRWAQKWPQAVFL